MSQQPRPHGGTLINRHLDPAQRSSWQKRCESLPRIHLNNHEVSDIELIANGAFSPLQGFMLRRDYERVVREMRLSDGLIWSIPVTLAVTPEQAKGFREGQDILLVDPQGDALAILHLEEIYRRDKGLEAEWVYRTREESHPGVAYLYSKGEILLGGKVSVLKRVEHREFNDFRLDPIVTRQHFKDKGWSTVVGFQTRNPIHRAHEYIQKCALEMVDGLLVHPLVGETKSDDISAAVRMKCYEVLLENYYPKNRTLLSVLPAAMRYAGPREAIFHAIIRKNYGCTHFIVGRDHAGVGNFYGPFDAHRIFDQFNGPELGIKPLFFDNTFYCKRCASMASHRTCPHDPWNYVFLSGTKVREMLRSGILPPPEFTRPEVAEILIAALSPNNGSNAVHTLQPPREPEQETAIGKDRGQPS